ncbi:MAG TPA: hypothetical protein PL124_13070 [Candidatus Cloacimonadota bacterium]|nr:hypothetical protein [Candidatus Cloacimonadota bacterium]
MIYRIRIMKSENGVLVFDRYASDAELEVLKPKADGSGVERAEILPHIITGKPTLVFDDVSATHFVEWGEDVDALRSRIAELEKQAVVWHKYPDEKPSMDTCPVHSRLFGSMFNDISFISLILYVDNVHNKIQGAWVYNVKNDSFESDEGFSLNGESVLAWAYLPEPPREEG